MGKSAVTVLGLALLVLLGVLAFPAAITQSNDTLETTNTIDETETTEYNGLEVTVLETTNTEATVTVVDLDNGETKDDITIESGNNTTLNFQNGDVTVTNQESDNQRATVTLEYSAVHGYSQGALTIRDNLPIILITFLFLGVMGFFGLVIKQ